MCYKCFMKARAQGKNIIWAVCLSLFMSTGSFISHGNAWIASCQAPADVCDVLDLIIPLEVMPINPTTSTEGEYLTGLMIAGGEVQTALESLNLQTKVKQNVVQAIVSGRRLVGKRMKQNNLTQIQTLAVDIGNEMPVRQWQRPKQGQTVYALGLLKQRDIITTAVLATARVSEVSQNEPYFSIFSYPVDLTPGTVLVTSEGKLLGQLIAGDLGWYSAVSFDRNSKKEQGRSAIKVCQARAQQGMSQETLAACLEAGAFGERLLWQMFQNATTTHQNLFQYKPKEVNRLMAGRALKMAYLAFWVKWGDAATIYERFMAYKPYWQQAPYGNMFLLTAALRQGNVQQIEESFRQSQLENSPQGQAWRRQFDAVMAHPAASYPYQWLWQGFMDMRNSYIGRLMPH